MGPRAGEGQQRQDYGQCQDSGSLGPVCSPTHYSWKAGNFISPLSSVFTPEMIVTGLLPRAVGSASPHVRSAQHGAWGVLRAQCLLDAVSCVASGEFSVIFVSDTSATLVASCLLLPLR